ncbi:MAG: hypothetical protein GC206_08085 [Alphaproteobacteria bacterium]|nr:hypothetical protein [Alphaproteobacteria bacterium]
MSGGRYAAFLSYSQSDEALASWLQRSLEGFRVPDALVGYEGPNGPIGKKLGEVYLHNVEHGLGAEARAALERSDALVVLRPAEAARLDARDEVRHFASLGRRRIVSALVGEAPRGAQPFVWRKLVDDGAPRAPEEEGAAVDFRADTKAQREGAKLKLIATLYDLDIEELEEKPAPALTLPKLPKPPKLPRPDLPKLPAVRLPSVSAHSAGVAAGAMLVLVVVGGAAWVVSNLPQSAPTQSVTAAAPDTQIAALDPPLAPPQPAAPAAPDVIADQAIEEEAPLVAAPAPEPPEARTPAATPAQPPPSRAPVQVAAAPPVSAPAPAPVQIAQQPPTPTVMPAVEIASLANQLRDLGAAHSVAVRCTGRSAQESRLRARHLIASSPEPRRADLIRAFNEGFTAAEQRDDDCAGVRPTSG